MDTLFQTCVSASEHAARYSDNAIIPSRSLSRIQIGGNVGRDGNREERKRERNSLRVAAGGETFQQLNELSNVSDSVYSTMLSLQY